MIHLGCFSYSVCLCFCLILCLILGLFPTCSCRLNIIASKWPYAVRFYVAVVVVLSCLVLSVSLFCCYVITNYMSWLLYDWNCYIKWHRTSSIYMFLIISDVLRSLVMMALASDGGRGAVLGCVILVLCRKMKMRHLTLTFLLMHHLLKWKWSFLMRYIGLVGSVGGNGGACWDGIVWRYKHRLYYLIAVE